VLLLQRAVTAELPVPPQQNAPWTAPVSPNLPEKFADVVRILFMQGFADTRGKAVDAIFN
jgi:hypothetical protein